MKHILAIFTCFLASLALVSFIPQPDKSFDIKKKLKHNFALVPSGTVIIEGNTSAIKSFYISKTEVSNEDYNLFVKDIAASGDKVLLEKVQMDNQKWETVCHNTPFVTLYSTHQSYSNYPAVNITYEGAVEYCKWLTENANKDSKKGPVYEARLPTREEWVRAAEGNLSRINYAWGGQYVRNSKGCDLCQYNGTSEAVPLYDIRNYPCKTDAYFPNTIGLYNMNGNAAEMVAQKGMAVGGSWASKDSEVKILSTMTYQEPSPIVGFRPIVMITEK